MNKKTLGLGLGALVIGLGIVSVSAGTVLAYRGDPAVKGPNYSQERHDAMTKTFEDKDYEAWKNLMQDRGRVTQVVNENNFAKFAEAHELAEQGKIAEAQKIRQELGLGLHDGSGKAAHRNGAGRGMNR